MTKKTNTKALVLTEIQTMLYNTLINKAVGLTVSELEDVTGLGFRVRQGHSNNSRNALDALRAKGLIRVAGFKSSNHGNGRGSSIFQIINPKAKVQKFKAA